MPLESVSYIANGNISPSRIVAIVSGTDFKVAQSNASGVPIGISGMGTQQFDSVYHATAGHNCRVFGQGEVALLELGGVVSAGDYVAPDASGKGIAVSLTATAHDDIAGVSLQSGFSGEFVRVIVAPISAVQV